MFLRFCRLGSDRDNDSLAVVLVAVTATVVVDVLIVRAVLQAMRSHLQR